MTEESTFPFFIHMITIPMTLGIGFALGWILRAAAEKRGAAKPRHLTPPR